MWRAAEASTYVKAPRSVVYSVLTSYDLYRTWVPDLTDSRLFAREGDMAVAELICPRYSAEKFLLEIIETPTESIAFRRIDHDRLELSGGFELEEVDRGESVVARVRLRLKRGPHQLLAGRAMREVLGRTVEALKERSLRLAARQGSAAGPGEVILDLTRSEGGLVVELGESRYEAAAPAEEE